MIFALKKMASLIKSYIYSLATSPANCHVTNHLTRLITILAID